LASEYNADFFKTNKIITRVEALIISISLILCLTVNYKEIYMSYQERTFSAAILKFHQFPFDLLFPT